MALVTAATSTPMTASIAKLITIEQWEAQDVFLNVESDYTNTILCVRVVQLDVLSATLRQIFNALLVYLRVPSTI